jgi:hypothetical protein
MWPDKVEKPNQCRPTHIIFRRGISAEMMVFLRLVQTLPAQFAVQVFIEPTQADLSFNGTALPGTHGCNQSAL